MAMIAAPADDPAKITLSRSGFMSRRFSEELVEDVVPMLEICVRVLGNILRCHDYEVEVIVE